MNKYAIVLIEAKQPPYRLIYTLSLMELKTLKSYIKTHLKIKFTQFFKSPVGAPIFFDKKPDGSFYLYINYWDLNNLTIKYQYPLLLIGESLDYLGRAKQFTQLNLINAYYQRRVQEDDK